MKQRHSKIAIILGVVAALIGLIYFSGVTRYLSFSYFSTRKDMLKWVVQRHYGLSVLYYVLLYTAVIACAVPAVAPLTMLAGFLFGVFPGFVYSLVGSVAGATVSFLVVRYVLAQALHKKYKVRLREFTEKIEQQGVASYLLMMQFLTVVPFFVINTLAALANVRLITFIWTTLVGSMPIVFLYALAGRQLSHISSAKDIFSGPVVLFLGCLICLALLPLLIRFIRSRHADEHDELTPQL